MFQIVNIVEMLARNFVDTAGSTLVEIIFHNVGEAGSDSTSPIAWNRLQHCVKFRNCEKNRGYALPLVHVKLALCRLDESV